ncbi:MAG: hypothetical protein PVG71_07295, partial [Anaerolineae bacterium]
MRRSQGQGLKPLPRQVPRSLRSIVSSIAVRHSSFVIRHLSFVVFLIFLALYVATLLPDILPADSGEFQRITVTAGIAH